MPNTTVYLLKIMRNCEIRVFDFWIILILLICRTCFFSSFYIVYELIKRQSNVLESSVKITLWSFDTN